MFPLPNQLWRPCHKSTTIVFHLICYIWRHGPWASCFLCFHKIILWNSGNILSSNRYFLENFYLFFSCFCSSVSTGLEVKLFPTVLYSIWYRFNLSLCGIWSNLSKKKKIYVPFEVGLFWFLGDYSLCHFKVALFQFSNFHVWF